MRRYLDVRAPDNVRYAAAGMSVRRTAAVRTIDILLNNETRKLATELGRSGGRVVRLPPPGIPAGAAGFESSVHYANRGVGGLRKLSPGSLNCAGI
jgi:hypothetical protein